jgi:predicted transcriptional regulator
MTYSMAVLKFSLLEISHVLLSFGVVNRHSSPARGDQLKFAQFGAILSQERENAMSIIMEKEEAHRIIDRMPANATWDDLMREIYVREAVERGLADSKAGRTKEVREVRAKYGLPE